MDLWFGEARLAGRGEPSGFGRSGPGFSQPGGAGQAEQGGGPVGPRGLGAGAEAGQASRGRGELLLLQQGGGAGGGARGGVSRGAVLRQGGHGHFPVQAERLQDAGPAVAAVPLRAGGGGGFAGGRSEARGEELVRAEGGPGGGPGRDVWAGGGAGAVSGLSVVPGGRGDVTAVLGGGCPG